MITKIRWSTCLILLLPSWIGCQDPHRDNVEQTTNLPLSIFTVNEPLRYMASRLTDKSWAEVEFPIPASIPDPSVWEPVPSIIERYQKADLILLNGAYYAQWVDRAALPLSRVVNTGKGYQDRWIKREQAMQHNHGEQGEHTHGEFASLTWMDLELASKQTDAVASALIARRPEHGDGIQRRAEQLKGEWMSLHRQFQEVGLKLANTSLLASHPVYDYLERAYDLNLMSMHWEPDQFPSEEEWRVLDQLLLTRPSGWMLWEAPPLESTIKALEARQIKVVVILPQGGDAGGVDFMQIVKDNLDALASIKP